MDALPNGLPGIAPATAGPGADGPRADGPNEATDGQAAVDALGEFLGLSVLVEDQRQRPVWWCTRGPVDRARERTILHREVDPPTAAVVDRFGLRSSTGPVLVPALPELGMWRRWCLPLRSEDELWGLLWVLDPDGIVDDARLRVLIECAEQLTYALAATHHGSEQQRLQRDRLLHRLLAGPDERAAQELAVAENLPADAEIQVQLGGRGGWPLPSGFRVHVVRARARTAIGGGPVPVVQLAQAVRRAHATRRVLLAGGQIDPATWDGLGAWRLIVDAPDEMSVSDLHPAAEVLTGPSHRDLLDTARAVLDCGGDVAAAAGVLYVHRTTLYYRLGRIQEVTGVDLRDGRSRTDLQMALWLAAYRSVPED